MGLHGGLLEEVSDKLVNGGIIIADGLLADYEFKNNQPFIRSGMLWKPIGLLKDNRLSDRIPSVWRGEEVN